ncbi:hypothetical protein AB3K25_09700 [Leuconostoc sp. MS02]|uniref:Uncharacterized protein n=1 Tax=Leuconostoc aquikimchii TaxID=3236804 RepID=A0ABV3S375_9LACO
MRKKWVIIAIIVCGFGISLWRVIPVIQEYVMPEGPKTMLGTTKNNATTKVVENIGGVKGMDQLGLAAGVYDITILSDHLTNSPDLPDGQKGDRYLGLSLTKSSSFNVGHQEAVKFEPAAFKKLVLQDGAYTISIPGNYVVNRQIPEGQYKVDIHEIKRDNLRREKYNPATIAVDSRFLNGNGGGDGNGGVISSTLQRSSPVVVLEKHRLLSISFSGVNKGSYVKLTPLTD